MVSVVRFKRKTYPISEKEALSSLVEQLTAPLEDIHLDSSDQGFFDDIFYEEEAKFDAERKHIPCTSSQLIGEIAPSDNEFTEDSTILSTVDSQYFGNYLEKDHNIQGHSVHSTPTTSSTLAEPFTDPVEHNVAKDLSYVDAQYFQGTIGKAAPNNVAGSGVKNLANSARRRSMAADFNDATQVDGLNYFDQTLVGDDVGDGSRDLPTSPAMPSDMERQSSVLAPSEYQDLQSSSPVDSQDTTLAGEKLETRAQHLGIKQ